MKLSLSWIFDHLKSHRLPDYDVHELLSSVSGMPAEIDKVYTVSYDWQSVSCVTATEQSLQFVTVESAEWRKKIQLPLREDLRLGAQFLIKKDADEYRWVTLRDLGGAKDGLVPAVYVPEHERAGAWKQACEAYDYILEIENKSITNRPDLWSHRGIAREFAALLGWELVPEEQLVHALPVCHYAHQTDAKAAYALSIATDRCSRFAGLAIHGIQQETALTAACMPWMAVRLARVEVRPRLLFIDCTNYVMMDFGQPMHAFDAAHIHSNLLTVRMAQHGEKLPLLDGTSVELNEKDIVVVGTQGPLALAGIMGGAASAVTPKTKSFFLEAAHFDGVTIRQSSTHHKKRTESSIRFDKGLDPSANTTALMRYVKLLDDARITFRLSGAIMSVGSLPDQRIIVIEHEFIVSRLGISLSAERIEEILRRLGFGVQLTEGNSGITYTLIVPTWRAQKDITIKEDILEEVARCYGYTNINPHVPTRAMLPQDNSAVLLKRTIKNYFVGALRMREVYNYSLYDELFLHKTGLVITDAVPIKNPVSENAHRLITSVVPHLLKTIDHNAPNEERLRFFEWGRIWRLDQENKVVEQTVCAGVMYERDGSLDFYACKAQAQPIFDLLGLLVEWRPAVAPFPWMNPLRTADLVCQGQVIGYSGMVKDSVIGSIARGNVFVFALFRDVIAQLSAREYGYEEPSKYQPVDLDISMLVPYTVTMTQLEEILAHVDIRVRDVTLIDVFEKPEWLDRRSITLRCRLQDDEKTMTKQDIDELQNALHIAVKAQGIEVR